MMNIGKSLIKRGLTAHIISNRALSHLVTANSMRSAAYFCTKFSQRGFSTQDMATPSQTENVNIHFKFNFRQIEVDTQNF